MIPKKIMGEAMVLVRSKHLKKVWDGQDMSRSTGEILPEKKNWAFGRAFLARLRPESAPWNEAWKALEHCGHCVPRHVEQPYDCPTAQKNPTHIFSASVKNEITRRPHHWICVAAVKRRPDLVQSPEFFDEKSTESLPGIERRKD